MLSSLVDGYGSSDSDGSDDDAGKATAKADQPPPKPAASRDQFEDAEPSAAKGPTPCCSSPTCSSRGAAALHALTNRLLALPASSLDRRSHKRRIGACSCFFCPRVCRWSGEILATHRPRAEMCSDSLLWQILRARAQHRAVQQKGGGKVQKI